MPCCCAEKSKGTVDAGVQTKPISQTTVPVPSVADTLLHAGPGQLGIVWGKKIVSVIESELPELITRGSQTEADKSTQTEPLTAPPEKKEVKELKLKKPPRFKGNVFAMELKRRERRFINMPVVQVRVHHLHKGENRESVLFRLEKGWTLRFLLGPSLHATTVRLFCNHPLEEKTPFNRNTYIELEWKRPTGMRSDLTDVYAEIPLILSGSFNYYFTIDESVLITNTNGQGYFLVDPVLKIGNMDITVDCLQVQTVITKLLGPFDQWEKRLEVAKESGYNMIHFTPVQELGISNSAYSIRDQLKLSPVYSANPGMIYTLNDLDALVRKMENEWGVLSMTDLVFNHTSKDSPWLFQHPECSYNLENSPHLRPAYILDRILHHFSLEVAQGRWVKHGVPAEINQESQLQSIRHVLVTEVFPRHNLAEFFQVDVQKMTSAFKRAVGEGRTGKKKGEFKIIPDPQCRRLNNIVDLDIALTIYNTDSGAGDTQGPKGPNVLSREERIQKCCEAFMERLMQLNQEKVCEINDHIAAAVDNFLANARWRFVDPKGPLVGKVTKDEPLMHDYFVIPPSHEGSFEKETEMMTTEGMKVMAVNGWVMGDDPLRNFAEQGNVYLRRELLAWGDSVKLRYGEKPGDSQYLWDRMKEYAENTARTFHGVRLDNCHSTPIHVAEYMIDAARKVRPNLYVVAELFTGSEHLDNLFMNRLGITSLIREALNAWDAHEQGRLVYRYGGFPVGSFAQPRVRPLVPCVAHALFYDQTHDNPCPIEKRSVYDSWPSSALVAMANCATGSNRGYDQLVPYHIHVVNEKRLYPMWSKDQTNASMISIASGITNGKRLLNNLHYELAIGGFREVYVDQLDPEVVSVTRHNPQTHQSVVLVARTAFSKPGDPNNQCFFKPIYVQGIVEEILFEGSIRKTSDAEYTPDNNFITGLPSFHIDVSEHIPMNLSRYCYERELDDGNTREISFKNFTPGTVVAFRCSMTERAKKAVLEIRKCLGQFGYMMRSYSGNVTFDDTWDSSNFRAVVSRLSLGDLNRVLYRVEKEEIDDHFGFSTYHIPNHGNLCYSGLRGVMSVLGELRPKNDLGHPLCQNVRQGNWLLDYISNRLKTITNTVKLEELGCRDTNLAKVVDLVKQVGSACYDLRVDKSDKFIFNTSLNPWLYQPLGEWFESTFDHVKQIPRYLVPCYFDAILTGAYIVLREMALLQFSDFVKDGSTFVQALALGSVQFCGYVRSAKLPQLSGRLMPKPREETVIATGITEQAPVSLAAGLPHFAADFWRNWGRDTFISLRGMLLVTGRYQDARMLILAYAATLRHGLIPNLLSEGVNARYNCRDSVWWWLQAIQNYILMAPDGIKILHDSVSRLYPVDDSPPLKPGEREQPLHEVIQEALSRHASGIKFRERGAGPKLDEHMTDEGFNVEVGVIWPKGYVYGGNVHNAGTWMDKVGSSVKAGNHGQPATPRDGSAVELIGLCASALRWLAQLNKSGQYPYDGVQIVNKDFRDKKITFKAWYEAIQANFEKDFYIAKEPNPANEPCPELIMRRGIYKDCYNATQFWSNFQLRPNFCVTLVVAPDLVNPHNAWTALTKVQEILLGPLGLKTLDPTDWAYNGDYVNSNDSCDPRVAHGFNYHNGPEWVWPMAYFLRAKLYYASKLDKSIPGILKDTAEFVDAVLCNHYQALMQSPWKSLPELTNTNGSYCADSCRAQAWSDGCIMEVLYDLERIETADRPSKVNLTA